MAEVGVPPSVHLTNNNIVKIIAIIGIVAFLYIGYMVADTVQTVLLAV